MNPHGSTGQKGQAFHCELKLGELGAVYRCHAGMTLGMVRGMEVTTAWHTPATHARGAPAEEVTRLQEEAQRVEGFLRSHAERGLAREFRPGAAGHVTPTAMTRDFLLPAFQEWKDAPAAGCVLNGYLAGLKAQEVSQLDRALSSMFAQPSRATYRKAAASKDAIGGTWETVLGPSPPRRAAIWVRHAPEQPERNLAAARICEIMRVLQQQGIYEVLLLGGPVPPPAGPYENTPEEAALGLNPPITLYTQLLNVWSQDAFKAMCAGGSSSYACQIALLHVLYRRYGMVCLIGNRSGAMDGASLSGIPQIYLQAGEEPPEAVPDGASCYWHAVPAERWDAPLKPAQAEKLAAAVETCRRIRGMDLTLKNQQRIFRSTQEKMQQFSPALIELFKLHAV
jgi:hypothetical protein